jgi:hypothetical protein
MNEPVTTVRQDGDRVVITGPDPSGYITSLGLTVEDTKYLQQQLQSVTGVPGDLPALAKQERNTAGVTGRARKRGTIAREQEGQ